ncbi:MAG: tetratricopeptide repeat protein [Planctomycetes bacterium]|nr:tetratricopeptide repeat protein [Planctomycetota bacterium]
MRSPLVAGSLVVVLTLAVYAPVLGHPFIDLDDNAYVTENPQVRAGLGAASVRWALTTGHSANWHPLTWLTHMLDCQLFGTRAGAHHAVNLALHVAATGLLLGVLVRATGEPRPSAFVAAVFALHPMHVESVAWVAERKDVLSAALGFLTLLLYLDSVRRPTPCRRAAVGLALALGLMAKPMLVTLPFVMLLLDLWPLGRWRPGRRWALVREKWPLFALVAASSVVTYLVQQEAGAVKDMLPLRFRLANALVALSDYLRGTVWPVDLAPFYPHPGSWPAGRVALGGGVLAAGTVVALAAARRAPWAFVGWFGFLGTLVPVIGLVQVGSQYMADRYTYLPYVPLALLPAWGGAAAARRWGAARVALAVLAPAAVGAMALQTARQVRLWKDSETLFGHALEVTRGNHIAHHVLGVVLYNRGDHVGALAHFEETLRLKPDYEKALHNAGNACSQLGRLPEALVYYRRAAALWPGNADTLYKLGETLARLDDHAEAMEWYDQATRADPRHAAAWNNWGNSLAIAGNYREAERRYRSALEADPAHLEARHNLGKVLLTQDRRREALAEFRLVLGQVPDHPEARRLAALCEAWLRENP